jgi:hypothetical protein
VTADSIKGKALVAKYQELISCAPGKRPYRQWPEMSFEFSFVWFKPFVKINSARVADYKPAVNAELRNPEGLHFEALEEIAMREGEFWSRESVANELGVSIQEIEAGLISLWGAFESDTTLKKIGLPLQKFLDENNLVEATDSAIYAYESLVIADLLREVGFRQAHYFDIVVDDPEQDIWTFDFSKKDVGKIPFGKYVSEPARSFFMQTGFNDFSIVIHGSGKLADAIRLHPKVEGFFCNEKTDESWFDDPDGIMVGELKRIAAPKNVHKFT